MSKVLYVAGPMTGVPHFNFPLFDAVSAALRADGFTIISPAETDHEQTRAAAMESLTGDVADLAGAEGAETWGDCLARDVKMLADGVYDEEKDADFRARMLAAMEAHQGGEPMAPLSRALTLVKINGLALLPNWEKSRGARLEAFVGLLTGKEYYTVRYWHEDEDGPAEVALDAVAPEWVQHMLALAWADGIAMHKPL